MCTQGITRKMFLGSNSYKGFVSLFDYILPKEANKIFFIKGGPGVGKSTFMKNIGNDMLKRGYDIEEHYCSSDSLSLDGISIPSLGVALVDGTYPHIQDPKCPGITGEIVNLAEFLDNEKLVSHKSDIIALNKDISRCFKIAYSRLAQAKILYDEWESYIDEAMDRRMFNKILNDVIHILDIKRDVPEDVFFEPRHVFASSISPQGIKDYIPSLIDENMDLLMLDSQPGIGQKIMIYISQLYSSRGFYMECFHSPFNPEHLDMLIIPQINKAIINNWGPFKYDNLEDKTRYRIDVDVLLKSDVLKQYQDELKYVKQAFKDLIEQSIYYIGKAKAKHDDLEHYYIDAMNFEKTLIKQNQVLDDILKKAVI
ncbi:MAG: hypothetical protein ACFWUE_09645 [Xylanivirga thermophila]|jgi:hypothetical protein|uniref:hypothetical protein n=1 Tax=Xylanivirga thermophila TaxID=2496273 RepID=UPI0039F4A2C7